MITAILLCAVYVGILFLLSKYTGVPYTDLNKNTHTIRRGIVLPVGIATILLTLYAFLAGFIPDVFSFEPISQSLVPWLMPIAFAAIIIVRACFIRLRTYGRAGFLWLLFGTALVGFSEELLVRGIVVHLLQESGYGVLVVGILSSVLFGVMHVINYFNGQTLAKTGVQVAATVIMGIGFYISLVVSGTLWLPIVLHWLYDFTILALGHNPKFSAKKERYLSVAAIVLFVVPVATFFFV